MTSLTTCFCKLHNKHMTLTVALLNTINCWWTFSVLTPSCHSAFFKEFCINFGICEDFNFSPKTLIFKYKFYQIKHSDVYYTVCICSFLQIRSPLLKKSLMESFFFFAVLLKDLSLNRYIQSKSRKIRTRKISVFGHFLRSASCVILQNQTPHRYFSSFFLFFLFVIIPTTQLDHAASTSSRLKKLDKILFSRNVTYWMAFGFS